MQIELRHRQTTNADLAVAKNAPLTATQWRSAIRADYLLISFVSVSRGFSWLQPAGKVLLQFLQLPRCLE